MRILTFNWHEAYLCLLAKTGHALEVVERLKGGSRVWFYETRPLPANLTIVKEASARRNLRAGLYDAVIGHNLNDLIWMREYRVPKIVVFHNRLSTEIALGGNTVDRDRFRQEALDAIAATDDLRLVFISDAKRADWDLPGEIIPPGIDQLDYNGYRGEVAKVLRVGNFMMQRDLMLGYTAQEDILRGHPSTLLGLNPPEAGARFTTSWDDLKDCFRSHRVFLNTTVDGWEDGYNLAMLEAMATGMPVVSTSNRSSPIVDGENGFVSDDHGYLADRIRMLLDDRSAALRLGREARRTVQSQFPLEAFVRRWNAVLEAGVSDRLRSVARCSTGDARPRPPGPLESMQPSRKRILLAYVSCPATTAHYLERSLRKRQEVLTVGPSLSPQLIADSTLEHMGESVRPHDLSCDPDIEMSRVVDALPSGWTPDLFLWVESVYGHFPRGISQLECPTACYLINSHLNLQWHVEWAPRFDWVFVAQRQYLEAFRQAGCANVVWLPLACDPAIHGKVPVAKSHEIGFVGSLTPRLTRRRRLLDRLARRFQVHTERSFLRDMARTFSASTIVFNEAVRHDLNMRVFEALASGSMLLTDRAQSSGLDEMFLDRQHLVIYEEQNLEELAEYYLVHEEEREAIAAKGRAEVLRWHTFDRRAVTLMDTISGVAGRMGVEEILARAIDDPLLLDAMRLVNTYKPGEALGRLGFAEGRELATHEQFQLHMISAACYRQLGREMDAAAAHTAALRGLPSARKIEALRLLGEW